MKVCLIPGLGYDNRIFDRLDLNAYDILKLNWIDPKPKENIQDYARRLFSEINISNEKIIFIGHSLGGIIAQEIAQFYPVEKIILISSIKSRSELSINFKLIKPLRLDLFFTKEICLRTIKFWGKSHGFTTEADKSLFKSMVSVHSNNYLQWALRALSSWEAPTHSNKTQIVHIHGTNDKTLPYRLIKNPDFTIENGSHICVLNRPRKMSEIIKNTIFNNK